MPSWLLVRPHLFEPLRAFPPTIHSPLLLHRCTAGRRIACVENTFNNLSSQVDAGACKLCPTNAFSGEASTSVSHCECQPGYYDAATAYDEVECVQCGTGMDCPEWRSGITLLALPLSVGYWRAHNLSADVRLCADAASNRSACVGGMQGCKENTTGPYCTQCLEELKSTHHYTMSSCETCEGETGPAVVRLAVPAVLLLMLLFCGFEVQVHKEEIRRRLSTTKSRFVSSFGSFREAESHGSQRSGGGRGMKARLLLVVKALSVKLKILASFFQVATKLESVYGVRLPSQASSVGGGVLAIFSVVNLDVFTALQLPWACLGVGGYAQRLQVAALAPFALLGLIMAVGAISAIRNHRREVSLLNAWVHSWLPGTLKLTFAVFPAASRQGPYRVSAQRASHPPATV